MPRQNKINTLYVFTVEGAGEFPFDMLRYDTCWPEHEYETVRLSSPRRDDRFARRSVGLIGLREPTTARWQSFGWHVSKSSPRSVG